MAAPRHPPPPQPTTATTAVNGQSKRAYDRDRARDGGRGGGTVNSSSNSGNRTTNAQDEDRIGPYVIGDEIGRGSFATVYVGYRYDTNEPVAVKAVIRSKLTTKLLENLESEISILKRITHRNIVELKDCLKTETHIYLIMAFCSAGDLSVYIRKRGDLPSLTASNQGLLPERSATPDLRKVMYPHPKEGGLNETIVRCFLGQLLDAMRFLRAANVIHRDIKPQNLLLQPADANDLAAGHPPGIPVLKVADFGFARWLPATSMAETLCGSPLYMAPEILRYEKYDAKADLWSVGAVLFEMSVGKPPFRAQNHVDLLRKIDKGEDKIRFPDERKPEEGSDKVPTHVADDLKALIRRLLKRNPKERMDFDDFFREAEAVATGGTAKSLTTAQKVSAAIGGVGGSGSRGPPPPLAPRNGSRTGSPSSTTIKRNVRSPSQETRPSNLANGPTPSPSLSNPMTTTTSSPTPNPTSPTVAAPPPARIPSYIDSDPPPFARRASVQQPQQQHTIPIPGSPLVGRIPSTTTSGLANGQTVDQDFKVTDYAEMRRKSLGGGSTGPPSLSSTPPSAVDRFASSAAAKDVESMSDSTDSFLGKDYVLVEKRTVEINALADELASVPKRENAVARRPSRGFLTRPLSSIGNPSPSPPLSGSPVSPYPPPSSSTPYDNSPSAPFAIPSNRPVPIPHPYSLSSSPRPLSFLSSSPRSNPLDRFPGSPLAIVGSSTAAISKVLNMASLKIFGSPTDGILLRRSSARKPITRTAQVIDPEEDRLLRELEDIAQKALVIFDFADSRIMQILPPTPQSSSSTLLGTPTYFSHVAAREQAASNPFSPVPTAMRRTSSSSSERPFVMASSARADVLAAEAMVLYLKALAFLSIGMEKARKFWDNRPSADQPASPDFNEAVQWFRQRFNECFDKAEFSKTRCQDEIPECASFAEKLIYDRALEISRAAAVNELRGENPTDCETAYETALWMLYAILDETMIAQTGVPVEEEDRTTINKFVGSITARLNALRRKIG